MTDHAHTTRKPHVVVLELGVHELHLACSIFAQLSVGGDVRQLARTASGRALYSKLVQKREELRGG